MNFVHLEAYFGTCDLVLGNYFFMNRNLSKLLIITIIAGFLSAIFLYKGIEQQFSFGRNNSTDVKPNSDLFSDNGMLPVPSMGQNDKVLGEEVSTPSAQPADLYPVLHVVDGDTIEVLINGQRQNVRFIGIDTPETVDPRRPVGCFGKEASDESKRLLTGKKVRLEKDVSETDKYKRLLRYVYLPIENGQFLFVNDYLVREGYAQALTYPPDVKFNEQFLDAQRLAKEGNKGLWGKCNK